MTKPRDTFVSHSFLGPIGPYGAALSAVRPDDMPATTRRQCALWGMCIGLGQDITPAMELV
jgi:hypothetical protein